MIIDGEDLKAMLAVILSGLVETPAEIKIEMWVSPAAYVFQVTVAESDRGKVIGAHGRTVEAIRHIMGAATGRRHKQFVIDVVDPANTSGCRSKKSAPTSPSR